MIEKENRPDAATSERAENWNEVLHTFSFQEQDNIDSDFSQVGIITKFLGHGENTAIPSKKLAVLAGFSNARALQSQIARDRQDGALILSTCRYGGGYFLPAAGEEGRHEIEAYMATLRARAINTLRVLRSAKAALEQEDGQERMSGV